MDSPSTTSTLIVQELDAEGWRLELDRTDIRVFSKFGASRSDVIGFKTVVELPVPFGRVVEVLRDVCAAMKRINDMYVGGETLRPWPTEHDSGGSLVRTSFEMPFPFTNREFVHGLHVHPASAGCCVIAYTPVEEPEIALQSGFHRCETFASGQRVTDLEHGTCRVEHLMVYRLGGRVSSGIQDRWLRRGHVGAYVKEWSKLRTALFPPGIDGIDHARLSRLMSDALGDSEQWPVVGKPRVGTVRCGRLPFCPKTVYRTDVDVAASLERVVEVIADRSLDFLCDWNVEFMGGEILERLEEGERKSAWIVRVHYRTPAPLANREYIYYFSREWRDADEVLVLYHSIDHDAPIPTGFVRALLYPSVHRLRRTNPQLTSIEHLLATDLGGKLGAYQDSVLKGSLAQAQHRDMKHQKSLLG